RTGWTVWESRPRSAHSQRAELTCSSVISFRGLPGGDIRRNLDFVPVGGDGARRRLLGVGRPHAPLRITAGCERNGQQQQNSHETSSYNCVTIKRHAKLSSRESC